MTALLIGLALLLAFLAGALSAATLLAAVVMANNAKDDQ